MTKYIKTFSLCSFVLCSSFLMSACSDNVGVNDPLNGQYRANSNPNYLGENYDRATDYTNNVRNSVDNFINDNRGVDEKLRGTHDRIVNHMNPRTRKIYNIVNTIPEVADSTVILSDNHTALVSVKPSDTNKLNESQLKNKISDTIKKSDADIDRVYITSNANLSSRINQISNHLKSGKSLDIFNQEINNIINRIR